jgi:hypothetical protein
MLLLLLGTGVYSVPDRTPRHTGASLHVDGFDGLFCTQPMCAPSDEPENVLYLLAKYQGNKGQGYNY